MATRACTSISYTLLKLDTEWDSLVLFQTALSDSDIDYHQQQLLNNLINNETACNKQHNRNMQDALGRNLMSID